MIPRNILLPTYNNNIITLKRQSLFYYINLCFPHKQSSSDVIGEDGVLGVSPPCLPSTVFIEILSNDHWKKFTIYFKFTTVIIHYLLNYILLCRYKTERNRRFDVVL